MATCFCYKVKKCKYRRVCLRAIAVSIPDTNQRQQTPHEEGFHLQSLMRATVWSCAFRCLFCRARPVNSLVRGWNGDQALKREPVQRSTWQRSIHAKERMWLCILVGKIHCLRGWMRALYQTSKHRPSWWEQHPFRISLSAHKFNKYSLWNNHVGAIVKRFHQISHMRDFFLNVRAFFSVHHYMPKVSDDAAKLCADEVTDWGTIWNGSRDLILTFMYLKCPRRTAMKTLRCSWGWVGLKQNIQQLSQRKNQPTLREEYYINPTHINYKSGQYLFFVYTDLQH